METEMEDALSPTSLPCNQEGRIQMINAWAHKLLKASHIERVQWECMDEW